MINLALLHGGPGMDGSYFDNLVEPLKEFTNNKIINENFNSPKDHTLLGQTEHLKTLIEKYDINLIIAHSFGAMIALSFLKSHGKDFPELKFIFCNWVYNYDWLIDFNKNYPNSNNNELEELKDITLHYTTYYFENKDIGIKVLSRINYNSDIFNKLNDECKSLDYSSTLRKHSDKIISIASENEKLISYNYLSTICSDLNIKEFNLNSSSHFPFIENKDDFLKMIRDSITSLKL